MKYDIIIKNVMLLTPDFTVRENMSVAVRGNRIALIAPAVDGDADRVIDGTGKLLMPGFTDAHTHTSQQLLRGSLADEYPMIWVRFLIPFESTLSKEDVYFSAMLYCLQAIRSGITSFAESGGRHMEQTVRAALDTGMRAAVSRSMMDMGRNIPPEMLESTEDAVAANDELFDRFDGAGDGRIRIYYGMRQVMTCSRRLIELAADHARARNTGVHAHLCEHRDEVSFCLQNYKMRPAGVLDSCGMLRENLVAAHSVALSEHDITVLSEKQVNLIHCPFANLINHGFAKTPRMMEAGCRIGLGSDGAAYNSVDMFEEMRVLRAALISQWGLPVFDPVVMPVRKMLEMAFLGGASALLLNGQLGQVKEGCIADLILIDMQKPHIYPTNNYLTAILDTVTAQDVTHSIIDGKLVMEDRRISGIDEKALMEECAQRMRAIRERANLVGTPRL